MSIFEPIIIYCIFTDNDEATNISEYLVNSELAACINIFPQVNSIYKWNGEVIKDTEVSALIKTTKANSKSVINFIMEKHSYSEPAIIMFPIIGGSETYLEWLKNSIKGT